MTNAWRDEADERLTQVISQELGEANVVTGWTLLVTFVDSEGEEATAFNAHPNQRRTKTLGQLTHGLLVEFASIVKEEMEE